MTIVVKTNAPSIAAADYAILAPRVKGEKSPYPTN